MKPTSPTESTHRPGCIANPPSKLAGWLASVTALTLLPFTASQAIAADAAAPAAEPAPPPSKVNVLLNFEFASSYLTPRGMLVQKQGLVFQPLVLAFANIYKGDSAINSVTAVGGIWNCFGTSPLPASGPAGSLTDWYEIDPIAGVSVGFAKDFTLDVTYTAFAMQIFNLGTSQHLETKLSFNDSPYLKAYALHPYVSFWKELSGKAVANTDPVPKSSYYFDLGIAPSYTFENCGLKIEAPCRMLIPDDKFYGTGVGKGTTVGLWEAGLKGSIPLKFMPEGYGHWSFHAGYKYMKFEDPNLKITQGQANTWQVYCGISTFF
ncbi:MAG TPA: hypothetical protein VK968_21015 [Roseimicrobium sp.]|nr:hypothetical protein [Roseimicrobium sp.]